MERKLYERIMITLTPVIFYAYGLTVNHNSAKKYTSFRVLICRALNLQFCILYIHMSQLSVSFLVY